MSDNNGKCDFNACGCISIVISAVFGALIAVLFNLGYVTFITTTVWVVFGLAVLALVILVWGTYLSAVSFPGAIKTCVREKGICLLAGIIGTIISSLVALSVSLDPASILITIFIAVLAFFFAMMIIALITFLRCIITRLFPGEQL